VVVKLVVVRVWDEDTKGHVWGVFVDLCSRPHVKRFSMKFLRLVIQFLEST
jgi:hypothetical protein